MSTRSVGFDELTPGLLTTEGLILGAVAAGSDPTYPEAHIRFIDLHDGYFGRALRAVTADERFEILHEVGTGDYQRVLAQLQEERAAYARCAEADIALLGELAATPDATPRHRLLAQAACDYDDSLVAIDPQALAALKWPAQSVVLPAWDWALPARVRRAADPRPALMFWMLAIAQAFKFWTRNPDGSIQRYVGHDGKTGTAAIFSTLARLWGDEALTPAALRVINWSKTSVDDHFNRPPLSDRRAAMLREGLSGRRLVEIADYLLAQAERGFLGVTHAAAIARRLPEGYAPADPYLKKAQLLVGAAVGFLNSRGWRIETDLTAMADYQVPRVLRALGVLRYSDVLAQQVDAGVPLAAGGPEEAAIRAATVRACEQLAARHGVAAALVDAVVWSSQDVAGDARFHLTETDFY